MSLAKQFQMPHLLKACPILSLNQNRNLVIAFMRIRISRECDSESEPGDFECRVCVGSEPIGNPRKDEAYEALISGDRFRQHCMIAELRNKQHHDAWRESQVDRALWQKLGFSHAKWLSVVRWLGPQSLKL